MWIMQHELASLDFDGCPWLQRSCQVSYFPSKKGNADDYEDVTQRKQMNLWDKTMHDYENQIGFSFSYDKKLDHAIMEDRFNHICFRITTIN